jgi:predicted MarR family transcription regulator
MRAHVVVTVRWRSSQCQRLGRWQQHCDALYVCEFRLSAHEILFLHDVRISAHAVDFDREEEDTHE